MTEEYILEVARRYADQRGWTWLDPVEIRAVSWASLPAFQVDTNVGNRGLNISIILDAADGSVMHAGFLPR